MSSQSLYSKAAATTQSKPSLGISRDIDLFARHWAWLSDQPRDINASLRLLVEQASRDLQGKYRAQKLKEECYFLMRDLAGDSPFFEDASRALFLNDLQLLTELVSKWPSDSANKLIALATEACSADSAAANTRGV